MDEGRSIDWQAAIVSTWWNDMPSYYDVSRNTTKQAYKMAKIWLRYFQEQHDPVDYLRHLVYLAWAVRKVYLHPTQRLKDRTGYQVWRAEQYREKLLALIYES